MITNQFTTGRKKIFSYEHRITKENVKDIVYAGLPTHEQNVREIEWLFQLYKGYDGTLADRKRKGVHRETNVKAFVSFYSLIADYKANLFLQNPLIYVNVDGNEQASEDLMFYNKIKRNNNDYARSKETALHASIAGLAYRYVEMDKYLKVKTSVLSPKSVMVIYGDDTDDESIAKVYITQVLDKDSKLLSEVTGEKGISSFNTKNRYTVYTDDFIYSWTDGDKDVEVNESMPWGCPIIEYRLNPFAIGSFERTVSLIQLLSILRSDGVNGVIQAISGLVFGKNIGAPIIYDTDDEETIEKKTEILNVLSKQMRDYKELFVNDSSKEAPASLEYIATEMYNADIEVLISGIKGDIITISNIPNTALNIGGSGNAGAAETASGRDNALEDAKNSEPFWFESSREQLRKELSICHYQGELLNLYSGDIEFAMQRSINISPIIATQAYQTLVNSGVKISDAAEKAGLTADPVSFEKRTIENIERLEKLKLEYLKKEQEILNKGEETSNEVITVVE